MGGWFQTYANKSATARFGRLAVGKISLESRVYPYELFSIPPPMTVPSRNAGDAPVPSLEDLRALALAKFGKNACNFQLEFAHALLEGKKHVLLQAGCGMGKTLGFWIPLLAKPTGLLIVVSPLTLLGDQHVNELSRAGIAAINVDADTITELPRVFEVKTLITVPYLTLRTRRTSSMGCTVLWLLVPNNL